MAKKVVSLQEKKLEEENKKLKQLLFLEQKKHAQTALRLREARRDADILRVKNQQLITENKKLSLDVSRWR